MNEQISAMGLTTLFYDSLPKFSWWKTVCIYMYYIYTATLEIFSEIQSDLIDPGFTDFISW